LHFNEHFESPSHFFGNVLSLVPEWINSRRVYFEPETGGKVKIFGFYNNKPKNKNKKGRVWDSAFIQARVGLNCSNRQI